MKKARLLEIEARKAEINQLIERGELSPEEVENFITEVDGLNAELIQARESQEKLVALRNAISEGRIGENDNIISRFSSKDNNGSEESDTDPYNSTEYRTAFMEYVCRGTPLPDNFTKNMSIEYRAGAVTSTGDVGAVIPTTILNEIIMKAESYGHIFSGVRRMNIQGGVSVPIMTLKPTASWINELTPSNTQRLNANESIIFNYYGLECRIAQTLLASVVTLQEFQRQFVPLAVEAMVKAIEIGIFNGTGMNSMLGVLNESRIVPANRITLSPEEFGSWTEWKKKVFGKMKKSYRNGIFIMAQGTFDGYIDGMVDANGQPIGRVNYGIDGGESYRFGGRRVETVEDEVLPSYEEAGDGAVVAVFMRLNDYAINTNLEMRVVKWEDHDTNTVKNKCIMILDGKVIDPHGILLIMKGA